MTIRVGIAGLQLHSFFKRLLVKNRQLAKSQKNQVSRINLGSISDVAPAVNKGFWGG